MASTSVDLLNKFASLGDAVNQVRSHREQIEEELANVRSLQSKHKRDEVEMKATTTAALEKTERFNQQIDQEDQENCQLEQSLAPVTVKRDRVQHRLDALKTQRAQQQQDFLDESHQFRADVKRLRLQATLLGLEHATAQAHAAVSGMDTAVFDGLDPVTVDLDNPASDPEQWTMIDGLKNDLKVYLEKKAQLSKAQDLLMEAESRKQVVLRRSSAREKRQQQYHSQLDRIGKETRDLESQLQEMEQLTEEAKQLAEAFSRSKSLALFFMALQCTDTCFFSFRCSHQFCCEPISCPSRY
jgi:chromosome segregation ATPase